MSVAVIYQWDISNNGPICNNRQVAEATLVAVEYEA